MFDILFLKKYSQIILDLDDTLIYEKDYLHSAYQSISDKLGENEIDSQEMFLYLKNNFDLGLRKNLFNSFIIAFDLSPLVLQCMLEELRNCIVVGGLNLTKEGAIILDYIKKLKKEYLIITNGNPIQQANKIKQINWDNHLQPSKVVYANEYKDKPLTREKVILNDKPIWLGETIIVDKKGGKSRKSRKTKKSRKSRKMRKTRKTKRNGK